MKVPGEIGEFSAIFHFSHFYVKQFLSHVMYTLSYDD
jgi:hypothetical protein